MSNIEVVGLGALNIDHIYSVERILEDGEAVAFDLRSSPGGSAANTIYALAKLGIKTGFCGVVGDDREGKMLIEDFRRVKVDVKQIKTKADARTGMVLCLSDKLGQRSLYVLPGANSLLTGADLDLSYINQTSILHLSSFANEQQFEVVLRLMERLSSSVKLSFAPGSLYTTKGLKALSPILKRTNILFLNQAELEKLTGKGVIKGTESCLKHGCQMVVVTLGKGQKLDKTKTIAYIRDAGNEYLIRPQASGVGVDTTGAGDAFAAGFLYGILKRKNPKECGQIGNLVAQFCISKVGAREGLPTLKELAQRYWEVYSQRL